jgi:hypothetical protein
LNICDAYNSETLWSIPNLKKKHAFPWIPLTRIRPTNFFHFPKDTHTIQIKETTLLVEFSSAGSILYSYWYVMPGSVVRCFFIAASVAKAPKEG